MKRSVHAKRLLRNRKRAQGSKLNLVSLMDIFTILVFFLLVNSSDVEVLQNNKSIQLPESTSTIPPEEKLMVQVTETALIVAGKKIDDIASIDSSYDQFIPSLKKELDYQASRRPLLAASADDSSESVSAGRGITIMGDKDIPYTLLKKILATCAQTEYRDMSLAVLSVSGKKDQGAGESVPGSTKS